jgi:hypothetical protein
MRPAVEDFRTAQKTDARFDVDCDLSQAKCDQAEMLSRDALDRETRPHMEWRKWHGAFRDA